jgi:hypothetical protein
MKRTTLLPLLLAAVLCPAILLAAPPRLVAPAEGAEVPILNERQRAFLSMPHEERVAAYSNEAFRAELRKTAGYCPKPVKLEWDAGGATNGMRTVYTVEVRRRPDGTPVFRADTVGASVEVDNLEIAREYEWTVHANALGHESATGTFRTEDRAPRLIRAGAVPNVRDLGGRVGLGGRRVRQGLVYRSAGLNENAKTRYLPREEALARSADPDALLAAEAALAAETNALAGFQARPGDLALVEGTLPRKWTVFRVAQETFDAEGDAALRALRDIPETFLGAPAEEADLGEDADFTFPNEARDAAAGPAVFLCKAEFSDDGWCGFGCGADWFWSLRIDGETVFDRSGGNDINPVETSNHVFVAPVRKGRHLVAAVVRTGSVAWRWRCRTSPPEPIDRMLAGKIANDKARIDRLFVVPDGFVPGASRINDGNRSLWLDTLGVRTDIDLRSEGEVRGMEGSPLGPTVEWVNVSSSAYAGMQEERGRIPFAKVFRVFLDPANYPIDFHCIAGQDRTGAVAFILNALLGVEEEELWLDWEATAFWNPSPHFNHAKLFDHLVRGFDRWPGDTIRERVEAYVLDLGFTRDDIATLREIMLEPAP